MYLKGRQSLLLNRFLLVYSLVVLAIILIPNSGKAIPESEAVKKLRVVPVFVITDSKGVPLPIPRERDLILPLYLERAEAEKQLDSLRRSNPSLNPSIVVLPLDQMNAQVVELNRQLKDKSKTLVAPVVGNEIDRKQAENILKSQGLTSRQIREGLNVPVFFTKPFLTIKTPEGPRGVFFFSYESLQNALAKLSAAERNKMIPQVADLTAVIREIANAPTDSFTIFPTPEYFRLVQNKQGSTNDNIAVRTDPSAINIQDFQSVQAQAQQQAYPNSDTSKSFTPVDVARLARDITVRIEGPGPSGSGTIIGKTAASCQIATAWHVLSDVAKGETIRIVFANGEVVNVPISRFTRIRDTDLAVIRVDFSSPSPSVTAVPTGVISPADRITVSGWSLATRDNPVLYRHLPGTIVSINTAPSSDGYSILYTTSSPTLEGMSGGPVINDRGLLVGIHGRAERLPITDVEGVKDVATTNGQALPVTLITNGT